MQACCLPGLHVGVKYYVHLLQCPLSCFRVPEEYLQSHHGAEYAEDDVRFPLNIGERRGDEVCQCKVENPID